MSRLSMKDGRIVIGEQDEKPKNTTQKTNTSNSRLSMVDGRIVLADKPAANKANNQSYLQKTRAAQQQYQAMDDVLPQRRTSNVMDMAIDSLRNRVANSTIGRAANEWASRVSGNIQNVLNESPEVRAAKRQARADNEARRQQFAIDTANLIDQASAQYEGPTRTETVRGRFTDTEGADMFSNDWEPGEEKEIEYTRTVRNENYNPLSREDRDALISRYADAMNGKTDANGYQQVLYDVTKNGGIEQLYREQQADAANDREYGRQLRGVDLDSMNFWQRLGGTLGGTVAGAGEQIASSGLGLYASNMNAAALNAANDDSPASYRNALDKAVTNWYYGLVNGADDPGAEENIRRMAAYVGGDSYADDVIRKIRERAEEDIQSGGEMGFSSSLLDEIESDNSALWRNLQGTIEESGVYDAINQMQASSQKHIQYAKDVNLLQNQFGDNLVEAGVSTIQNAADAAMAATLGLSGTGVIAMIPFALRAYGGSYAEQMQQATELGGVIGQDVAKKAAQSAGISSAIEVGTEMMWGIVGAMSKVTGGGALDDAAQQKLAEILSGWAKTEAGKKIITTIGEKALGGITEGLEEVIGDAAEQILKNAGIMPGEGEEWSEWVKNAGHSFITGALGGLMGEVTGLVSSPMQQSQIGKQLKAGGITLNDGTKITVDDMVNLANSPGMEGTTLEKTYSSLLDGTPRATDSFSDRELGKLYEAYEETMGRSEEGAKRVQEILGKVENGEELKRSDVNRITNNPDAARYLRSASGTELNLDGNITERKAAVEEALRAFASQNETLRNAMTENLSPNAENANTGDLASRIENLPMINRQAMPAEIARSYFDASVGQTVNDAAERMGIGEEGRKIMSGLYSGNRENAIDYVGEMTKPYNLGRENKDLNLEDIPANGTVSAEEYQAAWRAGRLDYLAETARKEINNDRAGQEVLVREGAERMDGQNPVGSSSAVGEIAGSPQVGQTGLQQRSAGTERVYSGTQVGARITESQLNARDMAAAGYNVVTDNNDAEANAVKNEVALKAKKYGINVRDVVLFRGAMANVNGSAERGFFIYHPDGTITIAAQLDNADATGRQIITHEFTHALIKNLSVKLGQDALGNLSESGESSFGTVRDYMAQELGGQDKLVEAVNGYAAVYKAAGVIAADANGNISKADMQMVFEEMICDFVAGMNAFSEVGHISQAVRSTPVMAAAKKAVEKLANETRGSPSAEAYIPRTQSEQRSRYDGSSEMYAIDPNGRKYSLGSLKSDIFDNKFQHDLVNKLGWTPDRVKNLVNSLNLLMEYIKPNRDILDLNESYTKDTRPYSPYKPNSDPLYKISLDYSTLCRKRLMTQYIIEKLQLREHRPMSGEEQIAIRDMLQEYRQIESGLQVACAMCYVEAARLKSPDQMNRYFEDPTPVLKNYFAQKNKVYKRKVESLQKKWKADHGYDANAAKKEMSPADIAAFNEYSSKIRHDYNPATDQVDAKRRKEELDAIERAKTLSPDNYLSAANLADLKEKDQLIYDAYTSNIRAATRSKGLETDVPYYYGDSRKKGGPSDKFIRNVNAENGMRFSSWSDFQFTHLLDQMMAVIDLSVRKAAMHGYTKFPEQVRIFGKTGAMFNMSGVPDATGLTENGYLRFSPTESIDIKEAKRLRNEFPETAGLQCIGISDEHVKALLSADYIDYVIPYHVSGLNAVLRQMVKIATWKDYTGSQEESVIDSKAKWEDSGKRCPEEKWHKAPVFSEFFNPAWYTDPAYKGRGVEAMREAADRYVQMCADRGMRPKFPQFLNEANYWKLLIDRKMVNQKTGDLIQQKPVTPDFDFNVIKKEIADYVSKTRAEQGIEDRAFDYVVKHLDEMPGRVETLKQEGAVEKNIAKAEERKRKAAEHQASVLGNEMYAAAPKNVAAYKYSQDLDSAYMAAAERGDTETAQRLVDEAAEEAMPDSEIRNKNGKLLKVYHGTDADFNVFDTTVSGGKNGRAEGFGIYLSPDQEVTKSYGDRQIGMFANITKPAYSNRKTISVTKLKALLKSTCEAEAKEMAEDYGGSVKDALKDTWISNYVDTYSNSMEIAYTKAAQDILRMNGSDMEVIQEVMAGMAIREYADAIAFYNDHLTPVTGFDGFWTEWTNRETGKKTPVILAFNSNQLKVADAITRNDDGNIIPLDERFNPKNDDIRYSRDIDSAYMAAVESKDMKTARKMVQDAAIDAGAFTDGGKKPVSFYHGTSKDFTVFDAEKMGDYGTYGIGHYFADNKKIADDYGYKGHIIKSYLISDKVATKESHNITADSVSRFLEEYDLPFGSTIGRYTDSVEDWLSRRSDADAVSDLVEWARKYETGKTKTDTMNDIINILGVDAQYRSTGGGYTGYLIVYNNKTIKSAEPIVRDNNGNIIPLSERFNLKNDDIRYSRELKSEAKRAAGEKLTENQFYSLYSAHKLDLRRQGNVDEQIQKIRTEGFKGTGGFMGNTMPTYLSYKVENGERKPANVSVDRYAPRKGDRIMFVPRSGINSATDSVKLGYRPMFDYEIVTADYDYQPYYEMYSKAYDATNGTARYSRDLNSDGKQLTKGQQEFFKDSQARDEQGRLLVLYHGTPNAGFNTFKPGITWLTTSKRDADAYGGNPAGKLYDPDEDRSYPVRVSTIADLVAHPRDFKMADIKRAFDAYDQENAFGEEDYTKADYIEALKQTIEDDPEAADIEFRTESKRGTEDTWIDSHRTYELYANATNPMVVDLHGNAMHSSWGDGYRYVDAWKDSEYDSLIIKNTKVGKYQDPATLVLVRNSNQVALTTNENPTSDPDIRFSRDLSNTELYEANRQLQKDLTELRSKLKTRTEQYKYWKGQTKVTEGRQLRIEDVTRLAREIIKGQESSADAKAVAEKMKALGEYLLNSQDENVYDEARLKAYEIAHEILSNAKVLNEQGGEHFYKDFRAALKQTPIYVTPSVREEVSPDGWNDFRKAQYGTVNMTADQSKGKSVDKVYHDLQATFGEWLLPEYITSEADQLNRILEVIETYRPVYENLNSYEMADAVEWTANEILTRIIGEEIRETNPTYADRMEKKLADQKAKAQTALKQVRQQRDRKVADLKAHYQQVAEDRRNRKIDSEMRSRLLKIAKRLNNKKLDRVTRGLLDQYIGELDLVSKGILDRTIKDIEHLNDFYNAYKEKMGADFIEDISIKNRIDRLSKKHINDLTQEEVAELTTVLLNFENMLRTKDKLLESQIKSDVYAAGMQTIDDIANSNGKTGFLAEYIGAETASPERYIHRITGYRENSPLYQAAKELSDGQRKMLDYQRRAEALFKKWTTDKKFIRRIAGKHAEAITARGYVDGIEKELNITPAMAMSLYLHAKNDDNMRHISQGGVMIPDMDLYLKGKLQDAYAKGERVVFTRSMIAKITSQLDEKEKAFADAVGRYYNTMSRDEINDVSEILKGFAIAGVENYFPIDTNGNFLAKTFDTIKRDGSIEGMGFLKERIDNASTPIMLYDLNTVLNRSISQHSKYVGLAIPVRNFEKLYNVTTFTDNGVDFKANPLDPGWRYDTSIATTLEKNWGKAATSYVAKMMADIENGTGLKDDKWGDLLAQARSKYAGAVLTTNASVAMKQAASYPTAAAVVGYKALGKALADFRKYGEKTVDMDKLAEYTPLYWYRSKGFVDPELGDIGKEGGHIPKALNWIQGIDMLTTRKLAKAAMYYVEDNNKALVKGTDAWWKEVAKVYNRIIEETQPNYTMMQRPQILRSDNALTRALNMFKTQPFQNFNILYDAFGNLAAKSREYKANATEENLQALKSARVNAARAVSSQAVSAIVFALMQWAWDAFRGKVKKYRDDDGEKDLLSWLKGMGINVLSSAGGMIPFGSYVLELGETMTDAILKAFKLDPFFDQAFYGLSENAAESVNDMGNAMINMVTKTAQALSGSEVTESTVRSVVDSMGDIAQFAGIPVNNVIKLAQSIGRNIYLATEGKYVGGYHALRLTTDPARYTSDYYDLLWKAYNNDKAAYDEVLQLMLDDGFEEDKIKSAMEKRMKDAQGVSSVKDLESRWMAPSQQKTYDEGLADLEQATMFQAATDEQQQALLNTLYNLALDNAAGKKLNEKITGGADVGIDQTEYLLYSLAISMTNPEGGTPTNDEAEAAILMVPGLTPEERSYLWKAAGKSEKSDPFK